MFEKISSLFRSTNSERPHGKLSPKTPAQPTAYAADSAKLGASAERRNSSFYRSDSASSIHGPTLKANSFFRPIKKPQSPEQAAHAKQVHAELVAVGNKGRAAAGYRKAKSTFQSLLQHAERHQRLANLNDRNIHGLPRARAELAKAQFDRHALLYKKAYAEHQAVTAFSKFQSPEFANKAALDWLASVPKKAEFDAADREVAHRARIADAYSNLPGAGNT